MNTDTKVSILMLTHNAPEYVNIALRSLAEHKPVGIQCEIVVVDNSSDAPTQRLVSELKDEGLIDVLYLSPENTLFAGGNNMAAGLAASDATHFVLLNSDVQIHDDNWLPVLLSRHTRGAVSFGVATDPLRIDGYCLLIDADLYREYPLDEGHQWWWSVTKQQAALLTAGYAVGGFAEHEKYIHHFGGKSGSAFESAKGMNVSRSEVFEWFHGLEPEIFDRGAKGEIPGHAQPAPTARLVAKSRRMVGGVLRRVGLR